MVDELVAAAPHGRRRGRAAPGSRGRPPGRRPRHGPAATPVASRRVGTPHADLTAAPLRAPCAATRRAPRVAPRRSVGQGGPVQRSDLEGNPRHARAVAAQQGARAGRAGRAHRRGRGVPRGQRRGLARLPGADAAHRRHVRAAGLPLRVLHLRHALVRQRGLRARGRGRRRPDPRPRADRRASRRCGRPARRPAPSGTCATARPSCARPWGSPAPTTGPTCWPPGRPGRAARRCRAWSACWTTGHRRPGVPAAGPGSASRRRRRSAGDSGCRASPSVSRA